MERKLRPAMYYPARPINGENEKEERKNILARNDNLSVQRGFRPHSMERAVVRHGAKMASESDAALHFFLPLQRRELDEAII